jgi:NTE family protein
MKGTPPQTGNHRGMPAKRVNLALQGGGAHGAFTWGVLDRLLDDHGLEVDSICGTSAGAMNAAVLASGYAADGRDGARRALESFWRRIAESGRFSPFRRTLVERLRGTWRIENSFGLLFAETLARLLSPYQLNPFNYNFLTSVLKESVDFDMIRYASGIKLFICATNVRTGRIKVFKNDEVRLEVLLASACLPQLFQAVEVDGEAYWDGGYMGNPAIYPLAYESQARDIIIVQIDPLYREEIPKTPREIVDRLNEITFNATLIREMRAIHFVNRLIDAGVLGPPEYKRNNIHLIEAEDVMKTLGVSSKMNVEWEFFTYLKDVGRQAADRWLTQNYELLGIRSSVDVARTYL